MIIFELTNREDDPVYQQLEISNGNRHYDFLRSIVLASISTGRAFLSQHVIKALNYHAIACLHTNAGEYRPCPVQVANYLPPAHYRVSALMDDFVNLVNRQWDQVDAVALSTYVLWRMNYIHPFINGNGRTARAAAYFVLCVKSGGWISGAPILPELLRREREAYVEALKIADQGGGAGDSLIPLHALMTKLLQEQIAPTASPVDDSAQQ